jgi:hypothetical protein
VPCQKVSINWVSISEYERSWKQGVRASSNVTLCNQVFFLVCLQVSRKGKYYFSTRPKIVYDCIIHWRVLKNAFSPMFPKSPYRFKSNHLMHWEWSLVEFDALPRGEHILTCLHLQGQEGREEFWRGWGTNRAIANRHVLGGRDSSVGITTCHGLEGPGIDFRWGGDFPSPSRLALGPTQPPVQWVASLIPRNKAAVAWR